MPAEDGKRFGRPAPISWTNKGPADHQPAPRKTDPAQRVQCLAPSGGGISSFDLSLSAVSSAPASCHSSSKVPGGVGRLERIRGRPMSRIVLSIPSAPFRSLVHFLLSGIYQAACQNEKYLISRGPRLSTGRPVRFSDGSLPIQLHGSMLIERSQKPRSSRIFVKNHIPGSIPWL